MNVLLQKDNILKKKLVSSYSLPFKKIINLVTFDKSTVPVGSFVYKEQKYPGDIDIREVIKEGGTKGTAIKKIVKDIQSIIRKIVNEPGFYVADFKAGLDERFPNDRDKYIVRWEDFELLQGYKFLPGNKKITLEKAIQDPTIVKLDVWAPVNGRYIEASNFLILEEVDKNGKIRLLNGPQPDYLNSIREDIQLYFSPSEFNAFKATKREWLIAASLKDYKVLQLIDPLITGDTGVLYQVISDINTILDMIEKLKYPPYDFFYKELDNIKYRLSFINEFDFNEQKFDNLIDNIVQNKLKGESFFKKLSLIVDKLFDELNFFTLGYDKMTGLYPPPKGYTLKGSSLLTSLYQKLGNIYRKKYCDGRARSLLPGEIHPLCANFEGPGTKISQPAVRNYPPYNNIDACAKAHDIAYLEADKLPNKEKYEARRKADEIFNECISHYKNEQPYYSLGKFIGYKNTLEDVAPAFAKTFLPGFYSQKGSGMKKKLTSKDAKKFLKKINFDLKKSNIKLKDLVIGLNVELEHGKVNPYTNVTNNDLIKTGKIALQHLLERADYYQKLLKYVE